LRIGIIPFEGSVPYRYVKKSAAASLLQKLLCSTVLDDLGNVIKNVIRELKPGAVNPPDAGRFEVPRLAVVPKLLPPRGPEGLILQYPCKDQSSKVAENRQRIWGLKKAWKGDTP